MAFFFGFLVDFDMLELTTPSAVLTNGITESHRLRVLLVWASVAVSADVETFDWKGNDIFKSNLYLWVTFKALVSFRLLQ